jgi:multiple antibiotic resistance protein
MPDSKAKLFAMAETLLFVVRPMVVMVAALMPIVNPLGTAPLFLSMSADLPPHGRHVLARRVAINAFLMLIGAMLLGSHILEFFGISIPIVRVAGGLLVIANGWRLINAEDTPHDHVPSAQDTWEREVGRRAFYPLTFPLTVGPGSISVAVTLGARFTDTPAVLDLISEVVAVAIIALTVFFSYRFAARLVGSLGPTGTSVFLRLSSFILLCIGVAIFWSGLEALIRGLR